MRPTRWIFAFGLWTLFVWTTRIGTALGEDDLSAAARTGRVALAFSFTVVGLVLVTVAWRSRGRGLHPGEIRVVRLSAAWTVGVWLVRGVQIALADHEAGFIAVHLVLAVVSIGLAAMTTGATTMPDRHGTAGHRRAEVDVTP
jgi:hypothetical protein